MLGQASAAAQGDLKEQAASATFAQQLRERDTAHASSIKQLESQLKSSEADMHRMQANVSLLLESTRREHEKGIAAARQEARAANTRAGAASAAAASSAAAAASSLSRLQDLEALDDDLSMTAIAKKVLSGNALDSALAVVSLDEVGRRGDVGERRLADIGGVVGAVLDVLLGATPLGQSDPTAVLEAVLRRRGASSTLAGQGLLSLKNGANAAGENGLEVLGKAYQANQLNGDKSTARTVLSVLVSIRGVKHTTIQRVCSHLPALAPGDRVYVMRGPNLRTGGMVVSVSADGVLVVSPNELDGPELLPLKHVIRHDAIVCTPHQISRAAHHVRERFPGAAILKLKILRAGNLTPARAEAVANFLRNPTVV